MEALKMISQALWFAIILVFGTFFFLFWRVAHSWWVSPNRVYRNLRENGFGGPTPSFPLGNASEMRRKSSSNNEAEVVPSKNIISHDLHSTVFPHFALWRKIYGKVFVYWLGTEPFLYVADPEFLRRISVGVVGKSWGKPNVFRKDREPMFGNNSLTMVEGDDWVRHRRAITPAFSKTNLEAMAWSMIESTNNMLDRWTTLVNSNKPFEIDAERELTAITGEIIAKISFGISYENGQKVFDKLKALQVALFKSNRLVGVPFSELFMDRKQTLKARNLGKEIDQILLSIITARRKSIKENNCQGDLLGLLLKANEENGEKGKMLTVRELIDESKTFFFGGHDTTALALTWTLLLLALNQDWQTQLREEIRDVIGDEVNFTCIAGLKKMGWVMNEVIRLYSPAPNIQRQTREDIKVIDKNMVIPKGTNIWIDVVGMNHDPSLWGNDVNDFKPERFQNDVVYGGCSHKMGFLPFGFGGRMCVGRNLSTLEYKIILALILTRFSFTLSPNYRHSPSTLLTLRPTYGLPLVMQPII
ncbi:cytokinin hydroxylase-like [Humulus lupulus]|uniref:cytokinin hydroxylase-like n=1 Tax=Humulus lupulus TaxID=3486 RepID=UPI002B41720F|nr:cytokinin hydroxylase-like [Humulus lupulus]